MQVDIDINNLSRALRKSSVPTAIPLSLGHSQQLMAAGLGYNSLAAFQAAQSTGKEAKHLTEAAFFVLDEERLTARTKELSPAYDPGALGALVKAVLKQFLPGALLMRSWSAVEEAVQEFVQHAVETDGNCVSEMSNANADSVDEVYVPVEFSEAELPSPGEPLVLRINGHITLKPDPERPYSGHMVNVKVFVALERLGKCVLATPFCEVQEARLSYYGDEEESDSPKVSLAQALATELGLLLSEAEELVDADVQPLEGSDGLLTGYLLEFKDVASPEIAAKLLAKYPALRVEVAPWFFEQVSKGS